MSDAIAEREERVQRGGRAPPRGGLGRDPRRHRAERMPIRAIAHHLDISDNTVKRALATDRPPVHQQRPLKTRQSTSSSAPSARRSNRPRRSPPSPTGSAGNTTILKERVRKLRLACHPVDPVSRTVYQPGELRPVRPVVPAAGRSARLWPVGPPTGAGPRLRVLAGDHRPDAVLAADGDLIDGHWRLGGLACVQLPCL